MGGMPLLETANWLHQVNGLYLTIIPSYLWLNNYLGPKVMEPVFCRDFLIAQFEKMATSSAAAPQADIKPAAFVASPGKIPSLPKNMFSRSAGFGNSGRALRMAASLLR